MVPLDHAHRYRLWMMIIVTLLFFCLPAAPSSRTPLSVPRAAADTREYYVSPAGSDADPGTASQPWRTIQHACDSVGPGCTVYVQQGQYHEKITVTSSGTIDGGYITIRNDEGASPVISGSGVDGDNIIEIEDRSYIRIIGFEIRDNLEADDGSGIRITGSGEHIEIRNNTIHEIRGSDAMGITVYGTSASKPIAYLVIDGNRIYDCDPAHSEALTLNGNVDSFEVTNNVVHDVNNIGIDFIGGEGTCPDDAQDAARNGLCSDNVVYRANASYGGGYAAGIYVDGGKNIVIERNTVYACDTGIEIGCENRGWVTSGITVRNNVVYHNGKRGISFGGYDYPRTGTVTGCTFVNNTCYHNDTLNDGAGELLIEYAEDCSVQNNIFYCAPQSVLMVAQSGSSNGIALDYNLWYAASGPDDIIIDWEGTEYESFAAYRSATGQDIHSQFDDPRFVSIALIAPDMHLLQSSPAIGAGNPSTTAADAGDTDRDGAPRISGTAIDAGAYEYQQSDGSGTTTTTTASANPAPVIDSLSAEPSSGEAPLEVSFVCTAHDPDGLMAGYAWDFDGDGTMDGETLSGGTTFTYEDPGLYTASVRAYDAEGNYAEASTQVEVGGAEYLCPAKLVLGTDTHALDRLRCFRDAVLSRSAAGISCRRLYYRHASEISRILSAQPGLAQQARAVLYTLIALLDSGSARQAPGLKKGMIRQAVHLRDELARHACPSLHRALTGMKTDQLYLFPEYLQQGSPCGATAGPE